VNSGGLNAAHAFNHRLNFASCEGASLHARFERVGGAGATGVHAGGWSRPPYGSGRLIGDIFWSYRQAERDKTRIPLAPLGALAEIEKFAWLKTKSKLYWYDSMFEKL
jgi:hypothetical protein